MTTLNDHDLVAEVDAAMEAKQEAASWTAIYDESRSTILASLIAQAVKTVTVKTPNYGEVIATVVGGESNIHIDPDELRKRLIKAGVPTVTINKVCPKRVTYSVDEDALADLIDRGVIKGSLVPNVTSQPRAPFLKLTVKKG